VDAAAAERGGDRAQFQLVWAEEMARPF